MRATVMYCAGDVRVEFDLTVDLDDIASGNWAMADRTTLKVAVRP